MWLERWIHGIAPTCFTGWGAPPPIIGLNVLDSKVAISSYNIHEVYHESSLKSLQHYRRPGHGGGDQFNPA